MASKASPSPLGRYGIWIGFAVLLILLPWIFRSSLALTMLSQMGYLVIICLSYNILLGQGGMLSFGHAVYTGLGSFLAVHAMNLASNGSLPLPIVVIPLVGGLSGLFFAALFGYVTTKKSGTTFAMITLGIGELVAAMSLMFPTFFGGEGGVTTNRTYGGGFLGLKFGSQLEVYYLIAVYCFISTVLMFAFTLTPLGRMLNAVRDNPERVEFVGYSTQRVRYLAFIISGFFAGIGGALAAINFEIVNASDSLSAVRSGGYLLFTFLGGATFFFGPMIGAVLLVLASVLLSEVTKAWLLYLGLIFLFMVMYAPGGIASLIMMQFPVIAKKRFRELLPHYARTGAAGLLVLAALVLTVEMTYKVSVDSSNGTLMKLFGIEFDAAGVLPWAVAIGLWIVGGWVFNAARRRLANAWGEIQADIAGART